MESTAGQMSGYMDSPLNTNEEAETLEEVVCSFMFTRDTAHQEVTQLSREVGNYAMFSDH